MDAQDHKIALMAAKTLFESPELSYKQAIEKAIERNKKIEGDSYENWRCSNRDGGSIYTI